METQKYSDARTEYIQTNIALRPLAKKWKISQTALSKRSHKEKWVEQRKQFKLKSWAKSDERAIETIADMNARHMREYKLLQGKGLERLRDTRIEKDRDAITALDVGIKGERTIRGEPTEVVDQRVQGGISFEFKIAKGGVKKAEEDK